MEFNAVKEKKRRKPKKIKSFFSTTDSVYPIKGLTEAGYLRLEISGVTWFMAIFQTKRYDLYDLSNSQQDMLIEAYWQFQKSYPYSFKEIYTRVSENNKLQQDYYNHKIERTTDVQRLEGLEKELTKLRNLEQGYTKLSVYPCIFGKTVEEIEQHRTLFERETRDLLAPVLLTPELSAKVFMSLNNSRSLHYQPDEVDIHEEFTTLTQPRGGISFKGEGYNQLGDGFQASIHVVGRPSIFPSFWIDSLTNQLDTFTITDSFFDENEDYNKGISNAIEEVTANRNTARRQSEADLMTDEIELLRTLNMDINRHGERIKKMSIRIFLQESTLTRLQEAADDLLRELDNLGFVGTVHLNEQQYEWQSIFLPYEQQIALPNHRQGLDYPCETIGTGFAYNQTNLSDPSGRYYGYTPSGGTIYWDIFHKTEKRLYYNFIALADMGGGKSTLLKTIFKDNADKGNTIRTFDIAREYRDLTLSYSNSAYVSLDGTEGSLNMLQVYPLVTKEADGEITVDIASSFSTHISRLRRKIGLSNKEYTTNDLNIFERILRQFYIDIGLWTTEVEDVTALNNSDYPIVSDLVSYIENLIANDPSGPDSKSLEIINNGLKNLVDNYGHLFNQHTSIEEFGSKQIVTFDISNLLGYDSYVFDIQYENAIDLIQNNLMTLGREEKRAWESGERSWYDIKRGLLIVDECHNCYNVNKHHAVERLVKMQSEFRKVFIGIGLATQRTQNLFPNMMNVSDKEMASAADSLRKVFGLCQYKILLKQDETNIRFLKEIFEDSFTDLEYSLLPTFGVSENGAEGIISINGDENIRCTFQNTAEELQLFGGGA